MKTPFDEDPSIEWHAPLPYKVPRQTYTPMVYALGISLLFWSFMTSWILAASGILVIFLGAGYWVRELVLQSNETVAVPAGPLKIAGSQPQSNEAAPTSEGGKPDERA